MSATDGVGTKTEIARRLGRLDTIGRDLVAMCADDVVCHGARAAGSSSTTSRSAARSGAGRGARGRHRGGLSRWPAARSSAARPPSTRASWMHDAFDLAGFCVGIVERDRLIDGRAARGRRRDRRHRRPRAPRATATRWCARAGDASHDLDLRGTARARSLAARRTLGDALLTPTRIYAAHVLAVRDELRGARPAPRRHRAHHRRRPARQPAARRRRRTSASRSTLRRWPVPPIVGFIGDARRPRRRRDAGDLQRRHRHGAGGRAGRGAGRPSTCWPARASRRGTSARSCTATDAGPARYVEDGRVTARDRGRRVGAGAATCGRSSPPSGAAALGGAIALVLADRACPGSTRRSRGHRGPRSSRRRDHPGPRRAGTWALRRARAARRRPRRPGGLPAHPRPTPCSALRGPHRQRPSVAAAGVPGARRHRRRAGGRRAGHRRDRPPRGRDARRRPDRGPGGGRRSCPARPRRARGAHPRRRAPAAAAAVALMAAGALGRRRSRGRSIATRAADAPAAATGAALDVRQGGLVDLARGLAELGFELVSTGGTARAARGRAAGHRCGGRDRLPRDARRAGQDAPSADPRRRARPTCGCRASGPAAAAAIDPFELVAVNLYRFADAAARPGIAIDALIEEIDIGGPTLVRAAAKNHANVAILTDPADYARCSRSCEPTGAVSEETRASLARRRVPADGRLRPDDRRRAGRALAGPDARRAEAASRARSTCVLERAGCCATARTRTRRPRCTAVPDGRADAGPLAAARRRSRARR